MTTLSGKDVAACLGFRWENLNPEFSQPLYEELAKGLNERYLAPLQRENYALKGLVRDFQKFISPLRLLSHEKRFTKIHDLFERSFQLLSEEQKAGV